MYHKSLFDVCFVVTVAFCPHFFRTPQKAAWDCNEKLCLWLNYNDLTMTSPQMMVSKGSHPQMALIQVSELL